MCLGEAPSKLYQTETCVKCPPLASGSMSHIFLRSPCPTYDEVYRQRSCRQLQLPQATHGSTSAKGRQTIQANPAEVPYPRRTSRNSAPILGLNPDLHHQRPMHSHALPLTPSNLSAESFSPEHLLQAITQTAKHRRSKSRLLCRGDARSSAPLLCMRGHASRVGGYEGPDSPLSFDVNGRWVCVVERA